MLKMPKHQPVVIQKQEFFQERVLRRHHAAARRHRECGAGDVFALENAMHARVCHGVFPLASGKGL